MKLSELRTKMMTTIAQQPREAIYFSHGDRKPLNPFTVKLSLDHLVELGLLFESNGVFSITTLGRQRLDVKPGAESRSDVNRGIYVRGDGEQVKQYIRPGALEVMNIPSRGPF